MYNYSILDENPIFQQYDLITDELTDIGIDFKAGSTVCSDSKNFYVISPIEDKLSLTILSKKDDYEAIKVRKTHTFDLLRKKKVPSYLLGSWLKKVYSSLYMHFSICADDKIYVFHSDLTSGGHNLLSDVYIFTICIKTMTVVMDEKLTRSFRGEKCLKGFRRTRRIDKYVFFRKLFFLKNSSKVFIKIRSCDDLFLVFDVKNQYFYVTENPISNSTDRGVTLSRYTVDKDDFVYRYRCDENKVREVRRYRFVDDRFVDAGLKHNFPIGLANYPQLWSICVV